MRPLITSGSYLPQLLFSVDLLLFKVFFQVKTNKKQRQRGNFCILFNDLSMFLLFFWQIMSEGSLASSFLRAFSWLTDPAPLGFF